jgi:hypothetical protein
VQLARAAALYSALAAGVVATPNQLAAQTNVLPLPIPSVSTIPSNGDVNPYGVAFVPATVPAGVLQPGSILVSNFNNNQNLQGTGTTIVQISPIFGTSPFFTSNAGARQVGLSAALGILSSGIVIVGYLPTFDGTSATAGAGGLIFINRFGVQLGSLTNVTIDGPWGMAVYDHGNGTAQLFVSNVLNGTVTRLDLAYSAAGTSVSITDSVTVASGFPHAPSPAALELGPSGLVFDPAHGILYVASEVDSAVYAIASAATLTASAGTGTLIYQDFTHLHGPLDLAMSPNGHLLVANSDGTNVDPNQPSELVEFTTAGQFLGQFPVDPNNGGAFGLAIESLGWGTIRVAAVDDNQNTLSIWTTVVH